MMFLNVINATIKTNNNQKLIIFEKDKIIIR